MKFLYFGEVVFLHSPQFKSYLFESFRENSLHVAANYQNMSCDLGLTLFVWLLSRADVHQLLKFEFWLLDQAGNRVRFVFYVQMQSLVFFEKTFLDPLLVHSFEVVGQDGNLLQVLLDFFL